MDRAREGLFPRRRASTTNSPSVPRPASRSSSTAPARCPTCSPARSSPTSSAGGNKGAKSDISCACHWTVNQAASQQIGTMWGKSYVVAPGGIMVPPDSPITKPEDLAGQEIAVGYHSGSHFTTIQALEPFLPREQHQPQIRRLGVGARRRRRRSRRPRDLGLGIDLSACWSSSDSARWSTRRS